MLFQYFKMLWFIHKPTTESASGVPTGFAPNRPTTRLCPREAHLLRRAPIDRICPGSAQNQAITEAHESRAIARLFCFPIGAESVRYAPQTRSRVTSPAFTLHISKVGYQLSGVTSTATLPQ